jgi:Flp pilus assembly secretin CpaC
VRRILTLLLASAACAAAVAPASAASRLAIYVDHSAKLQIPGAIASVIVGNPGVADVLVVDRHTVFVEGKGSGQTEVVLVDSDGRTVWQGDVSVIAPNGGRVSVIRAGQTGAQVVEMTCSDVCSQVQAGAKQPTGK